MQLMLSSEFCGTQHASLKLLRRASILHLRNCLTVQMRAGQAHGFLKIGRGHEPKANAFASSAGAAL